MAVVCGCVVAGFAYYHHHTSEQSAEQLPQLQSHVYQSVPTGLRAAPASSAAQELLNIAAEARKELCPLMGFERAFCPGSPDGSPALQYSAPLSARDDGEKLIPAQVGTGYDKWTRALKLPVLELGPSDGKKWTDSKGRVFLVPGGLDFTPATGTSPRVESFFFDSVWDFEAFLLRGANDDGSFVEGGAYSHTKSVMDAYRASFDSGVSTLTIVQEQFPLYTLALPNTDAPMKPNRFFARSLAVLPEEYDRSTYSTFLSIYGTGMTTKVVAGGMVEAQSTVRKCLATQRTSDYIRDQAIRDYRHKVRQSSATPAEVPYTDRRTTGPQATVVGGVPDATDMNDRIESFSLDPVVLSYTHGSFLGLVDNEKVRANLERALREYQEESEALLKRTDEAIRSDMEERVKNPVPTTISPAGSTQTAYRDDRGWNQGVRYFTGDFNNDMRGDMVMRGSDGSLTVWLSEGTQFVHAGSTPTGMRDNAGWNDARRYWVADIDGVNGVDILARAGDGTFVPYLSDGKGKFTVGTSTPTHYRDDAGWLDGYRFFVGDITGDGKGDMVARGSDGSFTFWHSDGTRLVKAATISTGFSDRAGWNVGFRYHTADFNGDGKMDLLARGSSGSITQWLSDGVKWVQAGTTPTGYSDGAGWDMAKRFYFGDVNGDKKADFIARGSNGSLSTWLSTGKSFTSASVTPSGWSDRAGWNDGQRYFPMDANADGRMDMILRASCGTLMTVISTGDAFKWMVEDGKISSYQDNAGWNEGQRYRGRSTLTATA